MEGFGAKCGLTWAKANRSKELDGYYERLNSKRNEKRDTIGRIVFVVSVAWFLLFMIAGGR